MVEEKARQIENIVNTINVQELEEIGKRLAGMHPTLQQNFMRVVMAFIKAQSGREYWDLRNEVTVKICKVLWEALEETDYCDNGRVHLPLI